MHPKIQQIPLKAIDGADVSLGDYQGDVLLVVNVASKCGLTPQYEALEAVHERFRDKGFSVLGFPANDFAGQEPGTNEEISEFCSSTYGVQFPMFSKITVTGEAEVADLCRDLIRIDTSNYGDDSGPGERIDLD